MANKARGFASRFFSALGPGLVTGAADDDPSGVATYTIAGAQLGTQMAWTALVTWPLMAAVQMMCARIGMVTGRGLGCALARKFPRPVLVLTSLALLLANAINIGADLSGMADAAGMLTHDNSRLWILLFGAGITVATVLLPYQKIAGVLKWLAAVLFAYVLEAFLIKPDWRTALHDTFIPAWPADHAAWTTLVAILGTTISPYLFFWQSAQEIEEEKAANRWEPERRAKVSADSIIDRKLDVGTGAFFSNIVMFFILLASASTLHKAGKTSIETSRQAAEALKPLAGNFAALLYSAGIIGGGLLAIPTLAGSAAYAFSDTFRWRQGLDRKFRAAYAFYGMLILSILAGVAMNFANISPVKAMYWSAVINGLLAPPLLLGILLVACDAGIMKNQPSSMLGRVTVGIATALMFLAAVGMFIF